MSYEVIARKWRPQTFSDLIGQEHVATTLKNSILQDRIAHAYLFVGTRGIGKTTTARIYAKALNCSNITPVGEPCCECESCVSITNGNNMDVQEIDAASNNSVSDMRKLALEVAISPVSSKYKIYIVDEVHMLTTAAWNALLKTIEEPPAHAKFLFATTEAHKVLATILSRCQRFDLRRIPVNLIAGRLKTIADKENVKITDSAINAISRAADGGMRDAQSLLDQMISFFSSNDSVIDEAQVLSLFGLTANVEMNALVEAILTNDKQIVIKNIFKLALEGKNLEKLFEELLTFLRGIQITLIVDDPASIIESGEETIHLYKQMSKLTDAQKIQYLLETLAPVGYTLRNALNKQVFLENIILKAMRIVHAVKIDDILTRLNQIRESGEIKGLEKIIINQTAQVAEPIVAQVSVPVAQVAEPVVQVAESIAQVAEPVAQVAKPIAQVAEPFAQVAEPVAQVAEPVAQVAKPIAQVAEPVAQVAEPIAQVAEPVAQVSVPIAQVAEPIINQPIMTPAVEDIQIDAVPDIIQNTVNDTGVKFNMGNLSPREIWAEIINEVQQMDHTNFIIGFMQEAEPIKVEDNKLYINFDAEFDNENANKVRGNIAVLNRCLARIIDKKNAEVIIQKEETVKGYHSSEEELANYNVQVGKAEENIFVKEVIDLFDGRIVDVHG